MTEWDALCAIFSQSRLQTYLKAANQDREEALNLYKLNLKLSEALYPSLCLFEITLRNRISSVLVKHYGDNWFDGDQGRWLDGKSISFSPKEEYNSELEAINILKSKFQKKNKEINSDNLTANLSFGFWTGMLNRCYEKPLWQQHIIEVFPDVHPSNYNLKRNISQIRDNLVRIRNLRNRVFHYEPLFGTRNQYFANLLADYASAKKLIGWLNHDALKLLESEDRFKEIVTSIPPNQLLVLIPQNTRELLKGVIFREQKVLIFSALN
jgi:hypothetical protein